MKITTSQKNLSKALSVVERVVSRNPSLPILNNILLKTESGRLKLAATNLEIGVNYMLGAKIEDTGEIAVPAKIFSDFISNVNEEKITLTTKNNILNINTEKYKTQLLGFDAKEFPIIPKIKTNQSYSIPSKILKSGLSTIIDSVAVSEARPELAGAYLQFLPNKLILAATDSFRLAERVLEVKHKDNLSFILPRTTVLELIRVLGDSDEIKIKFGDNQVAFFNDDMELVSRIIDGNYPDYRKVIPDKFISRLLLKKDELEKNVKLAGIFSSSIADIKLSCNEKELVITAKNSDRGEIQTKVEALLKNEPFDISLNYYYLLDGLKSIPTEHVIIEYTGQGSPLVMKPENDGKDLTYLIMPLKR